MDFWLLHHHARPLCPSPPLTSFSHPVLLISFRTSSCHIFLGPPLDLFTIGLHSKILLTILYYYIPCQWPHHFNIWAFMDLSMLAPPINLFNSWRVLILHPSVSWMEPKIFFRILLSKSLNNWYPSLSKVQFLQHMLQWALLVVIYIFILHCFLMSFDDITFFLFLKKALFPFFILVKILLLCILLSFIIDPRKLEVCTFLKLCCPIFTFIFLIMLLLFALVSKYFVFSWSMLNPTSLAFSFRAFNKSSVAFFTSGHYHHIVCVRVYLFHFGGYCSSRHQSLNYVVLSYIKENYWQGITSPYSLEDWQFFR